MREYAIIDGVAGRWGIAGEESGVHKGFLSFPMFSEKCLTAVSLQQANVKHLFFFFMSSLASQRAECRLLLARDKKGYCFVGFVSHTAFSHVGTENSPSYMSLASFLAMKTRSHECLF